MYKLDKREIKDITDYIFLEDKAVPSDVIFIPGCARPEHTEEAARLYHQGIAPLLVPSGGFTKLEGGFQGVKRGGDRYGKDFDCEADFLRAVLLANGVPESAVILEREATFTLENAEKTRELLRKKGLLENIHRAVLCCKAHHARRAYIYYHMVFPDVELLVHPVAIDQVRRDNWYMTPKGRELVFGELSRVGQQLIMMEGRIRYNQA